MPEKFTDEELLALLRRGLEIVDPPPPEVTAAAKAAYTWRTVDAELAELVFDSRAEALAGMRAAETSRQVTFRAPGIEIEILVSDEGRTDIVGQLVPPQEATVELLAGGALRTVVSDRLGRFEFDAVPPGPVRLAVVSADGVRVVTDRMVV